MARLPRRQLTMRVPLPLAALAPVKHGAYAREPGEAAGEVERCRACRAFGRATPALSERYLQSRKKKSAWVVLGRESPEVERDSCRDRDRG
jgi:hypothetical protein